MPPATRSQKKLEEKPSAKAIFENIEKQISEATGFLEIVHENLEPETGQLLYYSLLENSEAERRAARITYNSALKILRVKVMPTELHDAHQRWAISAAMGWASTGLLNFQETRLLGSGVGTTFENFTGIYTGSAKEPDFFFRADTDDFPCVVIESGWSESYPHLLADKDLWMQGNNDVQMVILLKWSKITGGRIRASGQVWRRIAGGFSSYTSFGIFPPSGPNTIEITRGELFGQHLLPGQNPQTVLRLDVQHLRDIAIEVMTKKMGGLVPEQ